jgi:hypothetical protein
MFGSVALLVTAAAATAPALPSVDSLAWLPGNTQKILGAPGDQEPVLKWLRNIPRYAPDARDSKLPDCWSRATKPIIASYQIWIGGETQSALLVQGPLGRAIVEPCIDETLRMLRSSSRMSRAGDVTELDAGQFGHIYLGWTPSWLICHADRALVADLISNSRGGRRSISPALAAAIARADRSGQMWFVSLEDLSTNLTGVSSRSVIGAVGAGPSTLAHMTFEYASTGDAKRAARAVKAASADVRLAAEIRSLVRDARPTVSGRFMDLRVDIKFMDDPATMAALQAWIVTKKAELKQP